MPANLKLLPGSLVRNGELDSQARPSVDQLKAEARAHLDGMIALATDGVVQEKTFKSFEQSLIPLAFGLARIVIMLFLAAGEDREFARTPERAERSGRTFRRRPAQARNLSTFFGVVRYWRTYMRADSQGSDRTGFHPLDLALGLTTDRLSMHLLSLATRLATTMSYAQAQAAIGWFLLSAPSTEVIEQAVLGLGSRTGEWFALCPAPEGDGDVLVTQFDGKASPTATDTELARRRGKRRKSKHPKSPRHRGRTNRARNGSKPRRKKGDKSKNGRAATVVVMYTLRRSGKLLLGPINKRVYASFGPKRHAFEIARREADKRGFGKGSGKMHQIVTDGDDDLAANVKEYFPEAIHTIDVMHVIEYLWKAAGCLYREGSKALCEWVDAQKDLLYAGKAAEIVEELRKRMSALPKARKGRRERLSKATEYISKRQDKMNYAKLRALDLEIGSGAAEGAVKHVIAVRFDQGGMRWIRERAEALLQLRCIEINGDWDRFIEWVHEDMRAAATASVRPKRLQQKTASSLPKLPEAA